MENKRKIAFCFSGQARTFNKTYPYFKKNLFDSAKEQWFDYDIFCAVEDDEDLEKINIMNPTLIEKIKSSNVKKMIEEKYWKILKQNWKKYYYYDSILYPIINWIQQFYKIYIVNKIKNQYSIKSNIKYDMVVRVRFDTIFINKINFIEIFKNIKKWIILNKIDFHKICDHFAFGTNKDMDVYCSLFNNFWKLLLNNKINFKKKIILKIEYIISLPIIILQKIWFRKKTMEYFLCKIRFNKLDKYIYIFTHERIMYENIIKQNINLEYTNISFIITRTKSEESILKLYNKTKYEL